MMIEEKITETIKEIKKQISENRAIPYESKCPFCGNEREIKCNDCSDVILQEEQTGRKLYYDCKCEEYQKELGKKRELEKRLMEAEMKLGYLQEYTKERLREFHSTDGVKKKYRNKNFGNFDRTKNEKAYAKVADYLKKFDIEDGHGMIFLGTPGTGKTHLAVATIRYLEKQGIRCLFANWSDLAESERRRYDTGVQSREKELLEVPVLVIDDLGKDKMTEWSQSLLYRIVNGRYERCKPLIITTNTPPAEMEKYGEATVSRLREMMTQIMMTGDDMRRKIKEERENK